MTLKKKVAGSWSDITTTLKRRAAGSWTNIASIKRRAGGAWIQIWPVPVNIIDQYVTATGISSPAGLAEVSLLSTGEQQRRVGTGSASTDNTWLLGGSAGDYEVRMTLTATTGTGTDAGTIGSWLGLSLSRAWSITATTATYYSKQYTMEVRRASDLTVIDTALVLLESNRT